MQRRSDNKWRYAVLKKFDNEYDSYDFYVGLNDKEQELYNHLILNN